MNNAESGGGRSFGWWGELTRVLVLIGTAANMTVAGFRTTRGHHWLVGVLAIAGVAAAAICIRRLDASGGLRRYSSWLFLIPAFAAAIVAAF
ncbi:MAG: hypothetical protein WA485_06460, partial [Candidatus Sulfotelmatobacter sp.]